MILRKTKYQKVFNGMRDLVLEKSKRYGDSALNPIKCFSKVSADESIRIRLDDKLKRIMNASEIRKNDALPILSDIFRSFVSRVIGSIL